jgi:glutathione S-transferase
VKLYMFTPGPFPRRVLLYMALKGLTKFEVQEVQIYRGETQTPEFRKVNPGGGVPVLETTDGQFVYESQAIMQYLEELHPSPCMRGESETERRRVDLQCGLINEFYYYCFLSSAHLSPYVSRALRQSHDVDMVTGPLWRTRLEQMAEVMGSRAFLAGETATIPDCMLFAMLEYIREVYDIFIPAHLKALRRWYDGFARLPRIPLLQLPDTYHDEVIALLGARV